MLTDAETRLLTAAVDRELTPTEKRAASRLLKNSAEARKLYTALKSDSRELRGLPTVTPPPGSDVAECVMRQITEQGLRPTPPPPQRRLPSDVGRWEAPRWAPLAAAASVLLAVCVASYAFFQAKSASQNADSPTGFAQTPETKPKPSEPGPVEPDPKPEPTPEPDPKPEVHERPAVVDQRPNTPTPGLPSEPLPEPPVLTSPLEMGPELFQAQPIALPVMLALQELDEPAGKDKLLKEFRGGEPIRIDLFCRDSSEGFDRLRRAFSGAKQSVMVDALAELYLKKKFPAHYAFYAPSLTPEEFATLLREVGKADAREEAKKPGSGVFDKFVLTRFGAEDQRDLSRLLGVPISRLKVGRVPEPLNHDITRSLAETTEAQVAAALAAKRNAGDSPSESPKSAVLAIPFWPEAARAVPARSKQIQEFLRLPRPEREEAVPVLLVLRVVNQ